MAKIKHAIYLSTNETILLDLIKKNIVSSIKIGEDVIVGRYGTNKSELRKILKKELGK